MATAGPNIAGTGADDSAVGTTTWSNPSNVTNDGDDYTTVYGNGGAQSHYLKATNFGFSVSTGATIDGIAVTIARKADQAGALRYVYDEVVSLVVGGSVTGDNKAAASTKWGTSEADVAYGGASDKWGLTPSVSDVNNANFGAVLSVQNFGAAGCTASVDKIEITITYTAAAGTFKQSRALLGVGW
jgi:hypothetical protein